MTINRSRCDAPRHSPPLWGLVAAVLLSSPVRAMDGWQVDGEHGELQVHGRLVAGACRLDMRSAYQQVDMGMTPTVALRRPGEAAPSVSFSLLLRDCQSQGGEQTDVLTGVTAQDWHQPIVSISFVAPVDPGAPDLLIARGVTGVALKLTDGEGHQVVPGMPGRPQFVTPRQEQLVYAVALVRTPAPLTLGDFRAVVNFRMSYD